MKQLLRALVIPAILVVQTVATVGEATATQAPPIAASTQRTERVEPDAPHPEVPWSCSPTINLTRHPDILSGTCRAGIGWHYYRYTCYTTKTLSGYGWRLSSTTGHRQANGTVVAAVGKCTYNYPYLDIHSITTTRGG